jgi:DNA ligase D-like protein (predicted polymerase)
MTIAVEISNPDKALFPDGLTKAELARYHERIAETMLPHVRGRPVHMQRFPDGIEGEEIQQRLAADYFPDFVARARVERKRGGSVEHVVIENAETLVYLADQACITPHVWLSRIDKLDNLDQLIFDLDPPGRDVGAVRDAARALRELLGEVELTAYVKTTGSRGLHVVAPLDRSALFEEARAFARELAALLAEREPKRFTVEQRKEKRRGRLYSTRHAVPVRRRRWRPTPCGCCGGHRSPARSSGASSAVSSRSSSPCATSPAGSRARTTPGPRSKAMPARAKRSGRSPGSALDDAERGELGNAAGEAGALHDLDHPLDLLVGERRLLGQALVRGRADDDALRLELPPEVGAMDLLASARA